MKIVKIERSYETCTESGWYGYDIRLSGAVEEPLVGALAALGKLSYFRQLKRPFFTVRSENFLIRGITGDHCIRAGFADKNAPDMAMICRVIEEN